MKKKISVAVALIITLTTLFAEAPTPTNVLAAGNVSITRTFLVPSADTYLSAGPQPDYNFGGETSLFVYAKANTYNRPILKFNRNSIPTGSTVSSASLSLYYYALYKTNPVGRTYYAYRVTETDWVEGTSNGSIQTGAADWNHRQHSSLSWTSAGGTYTATDGASTNVPAAYGWMSWAVTAQAQYAITNAVDPHFLIKDSAEGTDTGAYFYSKEEATQTTLRPKLSITFTAPWESYQNSGRTTIQDTFTDTYYTVYMKATGFTASTYNVAYYDGGASGGQKISTSTGINVAGDGVLLSSYLLPSNSSATAGTWHALVQPASGYTAFPADYNTAVGAPDTYGLLANDSFTVQASALSRNPNVTAVGIYQTDHVTTVTSITPQTEYAVKVTVSDNNTLANLSTIKVTIFYDVDNDNDPDDVPTSAATDSCSILTCTNSGPTWSILPSSSTTWSIVSGNCVQPTQSNTSGTYWFHFKAGKVAIATNHWDVYAVADNGGGTPGALYDSTDYTMNWYGEITVNTASVAWGSLAPGTDFGDPSKKTNVSVTYIANGPYDEKVAASASWTGGSYTATLNAAGTPGGGQFSLKANDIDALGSAVLVSATPTYTTIDDTGVRTTESGDTVTTNTLWLKLGTPLRDVTYSGTVYFQIAQGT